MGEKFEPVAVTAEEYKAEQDRKIREELTAAQRDLDAARQELSFARSREISATNRHREAQHAFMNRFYGDLIRGKVSDKSVPRFSPEEQND